MSEWQPIETAPKDGAVFLVYRYRLGTFSWVIAYANDRTTLVNYHGGAPLHGASHWMPLPEPPKGDL